MERFVVFQLRGHANIGSSARTRPTVSVVLSCDQVESSPASTHSVERVTVGVKCVLPTSVNVTLAISSCSHECDTEPLCVLTEDSPLKLVSTHSTVYAKRADSLPTSHATSSVPLRSTLVWLAAPGQPKSSLMSNHFFEGVGVEFTAWKFAVQVVAASSELAAAAGTVDSGPKASAPPMTMSDRAK